MEKYIAPHRRGNPLNGSKQQLEPYLLKQVPLRGSSQLDERCFAICVVVLLRSVRRTAGSLRFFSRILQFALARLPPIDSGFYRKQLPVLQAARESGVEVAD